MPAAIFFAALGQKQLFLKLTYLPGTLPLILTAPIINKLSYKSLYVIKILIIFAVIVCLMKYLINTTDLYKRLYNKGRKQITKLQHRTAHKIAACEQ